MHDEHAPRELQTEFAFTLPYGHIDSTGVMHREGTMRLATAFDEVQPLSDPRVRANQAYVSILLISRVLTRLGQLHPVAPDVVERLFAADFAYLQDLYVRLNEPAEDEAETQCPGCGTQFALDLTG